MGIDTKAIDTEITLELDEEEITVQEFGSAFEHFLGLVREVTKAVTPRRHPIWLVKIYPGSAGIGFYPKVGVLTADEMSVVRQAILSGVQQLEEGKRPVQFTDRAIDHARGIAKAFKSRQRPARLRIWNQNKKSIQIKPAIEETAAKLLEPVYEDYGSVEGTLEILSGHGKFELVVYDPIRGHAIKCEVGEVEIKDALNSFMRRVEIFGKVRYRRDGMPVSVKVEKIIAFPSKDELPSLDEIRGILQ